MATVINATDEEVVYDVDDGGGGGSRYERDQRRGDHDNKVCQGDRCTGWLEKQGKPGDRAYGVLSNSANTLNLQIWHRSEEVLLGEKNVDPDSTCIWTGTHIQEIALNLSFSTPNTQVA